MIFRLKFSPFLFFFIGLLLPFYPLISSDVSTPSETKPYESLGFKNGRIKLIKIEDSQGFVPPAILKDSVIFLDMKGYLHFADLKSMEEELIVPLYHPGFVSAGISLSSKAVFCSIDNMLYAINPKTGKLLWSKELRNRVAGEPVYFNNKVSVLTLGNYLYVFDSVTGDLLWSYQGVLMEQKNLNSASPVFSRDLLLVPFSNGEIIAFSEADGRKIWSQKFIGDFLQYPFNDISISPRVDSGNVMVVSKSDKVCVFDLYSGEKKWQKSGIDIKVMSQIVDGRVFIVYNNNIITSLDVKNGRDYWSVNLGEYLKNSDLKSDKWAEPIFSGDRVWLINSSGFLLEVSYASGQVISHRRVPSGSYHAPMLNNASMYFFTNKGLIQISE